VRTLYRILARAGWGIDDRHAGPGGLPLQVAALPFDLDSRGAPRFLLITSRNSGRWIIPKGWPVKGLTLAESAAREAYEEAGVRGIVGETEIGRLDSATKRGRQGTVAPWPILIFPLPVGTILTRWPEQAQRRRQWMTRTEAIEAVSDANLAHILGAFETRDDPAPGEPER
jgi:8-oxo-dGTP pyrophosphatase MutT (NUDIX family)